jgi:hypothetical protein
MLILCQSHHGIEACILGLATTSGGDGMNSTLEYMLSSACGLQWPHPIVPGAQAVASQSLGTSNAYPLLRAPKRVWPEVWVSPRVEEGGRTVIHVAKSCLPVPIVGWKKHKHGLL